ncbi:MAG: hypothetical protein ABIJ21_08140 [Nanoarchaeota archaeon]
MGDVKPQIILEELGGRPYRWEAYSEEDTGLRAIALLDRRTGLELVSIIPNPKKRVAAHRAWAGARHSRSPGTTIDILVEMGEKGIDPDKKLEDTFKNYGHASVADMARFDVHFNNCPMHLPLTIFNYGSINSGQEKSTRYQKRFGKAILQPLEEMLPGISILPELAEQYEQLGILSLQLFEKHKERLTHAFVDFYHPETPKEKSSLDSRVLDCVRYFLLLGQGTGFDFETSARDWGRLISRLKASRLEYYQRVGDQLEALLSPDAETEELLRFRAEAKSLLFDTGADITIRQNLSELKKYLESFDFLQDKERISQDGFVPDNVDLVDYCSSVADKMVAQYVLSIWPDLAYAPLLVDLYALPVEVKENMSRIIFNGQDHVKEMPEIAATREITLIVKGYLGELRDFNRHRAWSRFVQMPSNLYANEWTADMADKMISLGFGLPAYLQDISAFQKQREEFEGDLVKYYESLSGFVENVRKALGKDADYAFVQNVLPLAHQVNLWMHGDPKQASYLSSLRVRPGGHINYRLLTFDACNLIADSDPYLEGLRMERCPDPANREEFFARS